MSAEAGKSASADQKQSRTSRLLTGNSPVSENDPAAYCYRFLKKSPAQRLPKEISHTCSHADLCALEPSPTPDLRHVVQQEQSVSGAEWSTEHCLFAVTVTEKTRLRTNWGFPSRHSHVFFVAVNRTSGEGPNLTAPADLSICGCLSFAFRKPSFHRKFHGQLMGNAESSRGNFHRSTREKAKIKVLIAITAKPEMLNVQAAVFLMDAANDSSRTQVFHLPSAFRI